MNKKRQRELNTTLAGIHRHLNAILLRRRRLRHHLFPVFSALSGCVLLCFVAFFLLGFSPIHRRDQLHFALVRRHSSENGGVEVLPNSDPEPLFLVPEIGGSAGRDMWRTRQSESFYGCSNSSRNFAMAPAKTHPGRYLLIAASGGLNQQRTGITDAVVAAYILNATLVVPKLDRKSFWKDASNFAEIFDVDWFVSFLSKDVEIIKQLPMKGGKVMTPYNMGVPRKCTPKCYETRVLPVLNKKHAVQIRKFDYRLSNRLDTDLQKLRCRVNYHALKFTDLINEMGKNLAERMKMKSSHFIALHLRFEPDMLAFSGCYFGGGEKEKTELGAIRKRWKALHVSNPDKVRRHGRCPLTPEEVGFMLRALGFGSDVHIYVASGEVYRAEEALAPLKAMFPNFHSKETIASREELAPFSSFSSRMAALDFVVCDESDVFVTNNNGNMAKILAGRRRYFGHKPTIRPNAKKLYRLFNDRNNMTWEEFASGVWNHQIGFMGEPNEVRPGRGEFHENPLSCICEVSDPKSKEIKIFSNQTHGSHKDGNEDNVKYISDVADELSIEDDQDWSNLDYMDNGNSLQGKGLPNRINPDPGRLVKPEQPELEELFSD